jgi:hypothetical protein
LEAALDRLAQCGGARRRRPLLGRLAKLRGEGPFDADYLLDFWLLGLGGGRQFGLDFRPLRRIKLSQGVGGQPRGAALVFTVLIIRAHVSTLQC